MEARTAESTDGDGQHGHGQRDGDGQHGHGQRDGDGQHGHDQPGGDKQHHPAHRDGHRLIVLDADLPPPSTMSGLDGLDELSVVNRAVGILIDQGHHPTRAHETLRRQAAEAGVDPHIHAARLLRR